MILTLYKNLDPRQPLAFEGDKVYILEQVADWLEANNGEDGKPFDANGISIFLNDGWTANDKAHSLWQAEQMWELSWAEGHVNYFRAWPRAKAAFLDLVTRYGEFKDSGGK